MLYIQRWRFRDSLETSDWYNSPIVTEQVQLLLLMLEHSCTVLGKPAATSALTWVWADWTGHWKSRNLLKWSVDEIEWKQLSVIILFNICFIKL